MAIGEQVDGGRRWRNNSTVYRDSATNRWMLRYEDGRTAPLPNDIVENINRDFAAAGASPLYAAEQDSWLTNIRQGDFGGIARNLGDVARSAGNTAYDITGADNYMRAMRRNMQQVNERGVGGFLRGGAGFRENAGDLLKAGAELGLLVYGGGAARAAGAGRAALRQAGVSRFGARAAGNKLGSLRASRALPQLGRSLGATRGRAALGAAGALTAAGVGMAGVRSLGRPASWTQPSGTAQQQMTAAGTPGGTPAGGVGAVGDDGVSVPGTTVPGGNTTTPGSGGGTGGSTAAPGVPSDTGTTLPLSPADQAMFDQARIDALRQLNLGRADIDLQRRGGSLQTQQALREAGRLGATQAADLRAMAAETGFGSSPAAYGVGLSEIAQEEARRRMAAQTEYRGLQEQLARRGAAAQFDYDKHLRDVANEEARARAAGGIANVQGRMGI